MANASGGEELSESRVDVLASSSVRADKEDITASVQCHLIEVGRSMGGDIGLSLVVASKCHASAHAQPH
jgi:hypothetical protein